MRNAAVWLTVLVLVPAAHALVPPATPETTLGLAPLPHDIKDADVLALLAPHWGITPTRLPLPHADLDRMGVDALVLRMGQRAGLPITPEDAAPFAQLDPMLAQPVATLLLAMHEAWTLRDAAFATWTNEELLLAQEATRAGLPQPKLLDDASKEALVNAAIMLSDTIESIVIPQLHAAAQAGVWPASPVADPVGVLRIGGTGNDLETIDRFLQIDARGNDEYRNNAGGASVWINDVTMRRAVAVSLDLSGEDVYRRLRQDTAYGGASMGIAAFYDLSGSDDYYPRNQATGSGNLGVGLFRDAVGDDYHYGDWSGLGSANSGMGYARDDAGNDRYAAVAMSGGFASNSGLGLLWDRAGKENYESTSGSTDLWGYSMNGDGWFVDETSSIDTWTDLANGDPHPRAGNDRTWAGTPGGRGNDNRGGLAYLVSWQDP